MVKQRKIEKEDDFYMVLNPIEDYEGCEKHCKRYNCKGLVNLLEVDTGIEFILSKEVKQDIEKYKEMCLKKKLKYLKVSKYK